MSEVSLSKEDLEDLNDLVLGLRAELATLREKLDVLESSESGGSGPSIPQLAEGVDREEVVYHTIKQIESGKAQREMLSRQKAEELLSLAVTAAIADYKQNPPKHRA